MPKRKATKTTNLETQLTTLIDRVAPGNVTLSASRFTLDGKKGYELTLETRESKITWHDETLQAVVDEAANEPAPDEAPIRPAWRRVTRFQREVVKRTLDEFAAKHMARATRRSTDRVRLAASRSPAASCRPSGAA